MSVDTVSAKPTTATEGGVEKRTRRGLKLGRVDCKGKIMDVTDPDPTPKIHNSEEEGSRIPRFAFNYTRYNLESFSSECNHTHWVDVDALRLLAWDLMNTRKGDKGDKGYTAILDEIKAGTATAAGVTELGDNGIVSRRMTITYTETDSKGEALRTGPVYQFFFELKEGRKGDKGQITPVPNGKQFLREFMSVPVGNARKLGCRLYSYINSKESAAITSHVWTM